ncbi:MAG: NAD(P)H-quinone oxidoreductase [Pseudomonadota bacterium]|nr:NAD(P)H-quinone oxidoreductase [Pseudomonadota bacterium]
MKAIVIEADKTLSWQDHPEPELGPDQVAIAVRTTAVNRADLMQRAGLYPPPPGASEILGLECAGEIKAVGANVRQWREGDRVCALLAGGGYAETVVCHADHVLPIPAGFDFVQAAALPEVFATAWLNLFMLAELQPGQKAIVHAGASGVGTAAIQLCKARGNPVFVTVGDQAKLDSCIALGADAGHLRTEGDFESKVKDWAGKTGVAAILDPVGGNYLEQNIRCLNTDGSLVIIGLMGGRSGALDLGRLLVKRIRVIGSTLRSRSDASKAAVIAQLREQVWPGFAAGASTPPTLKPIIHSSFSIAQANQAFELVASNQTTGKVILTLS